MGLFSRRKIEERAEEETRPAESTMTADNVLLSALLAPGGMTRERAEQIPAVQACLSLICGTISSLPVCLYRQTETGKRQITDDPRVRILNDETGDTLTSSQMWRALLEDYFLGRGGYAYIRKNGNKVASLIYVPDDYIQILRNEDVLNRDYRISVQGRTYEPYQFLKLLRRTKDGMKSQSIVETSGLPLSVAYSELKYEQSLASKGGAKKGFLQSPKRLTKESMDALRSGFRSLYNSDDENVVVLNEGITFKESSATSVEMQLNENKRSNSQEVCKVFGIPQAMVSGNPSGEDVKAYNRAVMSILADIECSLNRDLLLEAEKRTGYEFKFDTEALTRGDIKTRYEAYQMGLSSNFLQIDDVRKKEGLEPIGFRWLRLGLDSVLYDPDTGVIFNANMNTVTDLNNPTSISEQQTPTEIAGGEDNGT